MPTVSAVAAVTLPLADEEDADVSLFLLGRNLAKLSLAYRIFRVVIFPGVILLFAVGWVLYVTGKKYEKPPSPAPVRTDLNTPNTLFETPDETNLSVQ